MGGHAFPRRRRACPHFTPWGRFVHTNEIMPITIDTMYPADWDAVRRIYLEGIAGGNSTFEVDAPSWQTWDEGHLHFARLVARSEGDVLGWAALSPVSRRPCYSGVAEVSVYVAASARRRGVGLALLNAVIAASEEHAIWTLQG